MISTQPVFSWRYFKLRKNKIKKGVKKLFYLSWEDALWDLLKNKKVKKGSTILVPDFYCIDVENNIKNQGFKIEHYTLDKNLIIQIAKFKKALTKHKPSVVVMFNAIGIKNKYLPQVFKLLNDSQLLIEDSVHNIIDPSEIKIRNKNHFIIDSLRKVAPIQGSNIYGLDEGLDYKQSETLQPLRYTLMVHVLWLQMIFCWNIADTGIPLLSKLFAYCAEALMIKGYNLIGDSKRAAAGLKIFSLLSEHLNFPAVRVAKRNQAIYYEKKLAKVTNFKNIYTSGDRKNLRGWPVIIDKSKSKSVLDKIRSAGLVLRFELDGSPWTNKQKITYLPMGLHITKSKQDKIIGILNKALAN